MRFHQMLANGGTYEGRRYLAAESVQAMTADRTPEHRGYGYGLTLWNGPRTKDNPFSQGTFGHGGAFGTAGWVDPKKDLVIIFLAQMIDGSVNPVRLAVMQMAESAVE
ncbi:MAG: serine hydrolase [Acidobacteria bacterium]|nr:serine hydrolase [Acidobacteriota bacterium]